MTIPKQEIDSLVTGFQNRTLPKKEWTHEAHLIVACWHLIHYTIDEATCLLRSGIIAYNVSQGGKNTHQNGYHETITLFWIAIIDQFLQQTNGTDEAKINAFLNSPYADKHLLLQYYSKEVLFTVKARARWVVPNLKPLKELTVQLITTSDNGTFS